jgi:hypothetical protein
LCTLQFKECKQKISRERDGEISGHKGMQEIAIRLFPSGQKLASEVQRLNTLFIDKHGSTATSNKETRG